MAAGRMRAVVVGAGSAGLASAAALRSAGLDVVVLEAGHRPGSSWTSRYSSLRLNTIRALSGLPGYGIAPRHGEWLTGRAYANYLGGFARHHRLAFRRDTRVEELIRRQGRWRVSTNAGAMDAEVVVVATGNAALPSVPEWSRGYAGRQLHAAAYRSPADAHGRSVLLVGSGNSAIEIATELAERGGEIFLSIRTAPLLVKTTQFGVSTHRLSVLGARLPDWLWNASSLAHHRMLYGDLAERGLQCPSMGSHARFRSSGTPPVAERGFAAAVRAGRIIVVPEVRSTEDRDVLLADGRRLRPDTMILATGYDPSFPMLLSDLGVLDDHGQPLAWGSPLPGCPGLFVVGGSSLQGDLREHGREAVRVARAIVGAPLSVSA